MTDSSAGVTITRHVPHAGVADFERVLHDLLTLAAQQPGHRSAEVLRGADTPAGRAYHIVYRFADTATLTAWETSPERMRFVRELNRISAEANRLQLTGMEAWFDLPGATPLSRHRMALLTWSAIWPLVSLALWQLAPRLSDTPFLLRTGLTTALVVLAMTYVVMPRLTRLAAPLLLARR